MFCIAIVIVSTVLLHCSEKECFAAESQLTVVIGEKYGPTLKARLRQEGCFGLRFSVV